MGLATDTNSASGSAAAQAQSGNDNKKSFADWLGIGSQALGTAADFFNTAFGSKDKNKPIAPEPVKKSDNTWLIVGGILLVIIIIMLFVYFNKKEK
jgi:hypothetical protein